MAACKNLQKAGFTLLEMSIVVLLAGTMITTAAVVFSANLKQRQYDETNSKIAAIRAALFQYRVANNTLPCPTQLGNNYDPYTHNFGLAAPNGGSCFGGSPMADFNHPHLKDSIEIIANNFSTPDGGVTYEIQGITTGVTTNIAVGYTTGYSTSRCADGVVTAVTPTKVTITPSTCGYAGIVLPATWYFNNPKSGGIVSGGVPTKTLQLPDDYAFDGWGTRLMYAVSTALTNTGAFSITENLTPTTTNPAMATMTIKTGTRSTTATATAEAVYTLWSYGPNMNHAFPRGSLYGRMALNLVNADETENCDCSGLAGGVDTAVDLDYVFVQKDAYQDPANLADAFDDILVYETRKSLALKSSTAGVLGPHYTYMPGAGKPTQKMIDSGIFDLY